MRPFFAKWSATENDTTTIMEERTMNTVLEEPPAPTNTDEDTIAVDHVTAPDEREHVHTTTTIHEDALDDTMNTFTEKAHSARPGNLRKQQQNDNHSRRLTLYYTALFDPFLLLYQALAVHVHLSNTAQCMHNESDSYKNTHTHAPTRDDTEDLFTFIYTSCLLTSEEGALASRIKHIKEEK